jgi:hypothetical protein
MLLSGLRELSLLTTMQNTAATQTRKTPRPRFLALKLRPGMTREGVRQASLERLRKLGHVC